MSRGEMSQLSSPSFLQGAFLSVNQPSQPYRNGPLGGAEVVAQNDFLEGKVRCPHEWRRG